MVGRTSWVKRTYNSCIAPLPERCCRTYRIRSAERRTRACVDCGLRAHIQVPPASAVVDRVLETLSITHSP